MTSAIKIGVVGAMGRMGQNHIEEIKEHNHAVLAGALEHPSNKYIRHNIAETDITVTADINEFINNIDAIIDFSTPENTINIAKLCAQHNVTHVIGTTGLTKDQEDELEKYAADTTIIYAPNMSIGVNLLFALTEKVASILDDSYDIDILEMHHNKKVDSPSGTALGIGKAAAKGRNVELDDVACKERNGIIGARPKGEIGFATLRGGDVVGDHTAIFATEGERIELTHKASSRRVFSKGAVRACIWAHTKPNGLYSMIDVLGL